eukprot:1541528-Pleurochrysis_carterae.AAC.1
MHDPKIAIADKLSSLDGANAYHANTEAHAATRGAHNVNDAVEVRAHATPCTGLYLLHSARV